MTRLRSLSVVLGFASALALTAAMACGGDEPLPTATPTIEVAPPTPIATATPEPPPTPEPTPTPVPSPTPEPTPTQMSDVEPQTEAAEIDSGAPANDAASLVGLWGGRILAMGLQVEFTVDFFIAADVLTGTVSVPGQGINGAQLGVVTLEDGVLFFRDPDSGATFEGEYDGDLVKGTFNGQGFSFGFTMTRAE